MDLLTVPIRYQVNRLQEWFLFRWRKEPGFHAMEGWLLTAYCVVLAVTVPNHEPWADEAQAWLIARDNSYWEIVHRRLHYEGSPPLWHFILRTLHLLHLPWWALGWCSGIFATAGIFVWLRWSPLPLLLRWTFPFTFFLQYQYAIVSRSYVLFPLLVFSLCVVYRSAKPKVIAFAVLAGLLANLCMQGMIASVVLSALYALDLRKQLKTSLLSWPARRSMYAALLLLLVSWTAAAYVAMPAPDVGFAVGGQVSSGPAHRALLHMVAETPKNHPAPITPDLAPAHKVANARLFAPPKARWQKSLSAWLAWQMRAPTSRRSFSDTWNGILYPLIEIPSEIFWPVATLNLLACLFMVLLIWWVAAHRGLRYLLPTAVLVIVGEFLWIADHHTGMLLIAMVAGIWLTLTNPQGTGQQVPGLDISFFVIAGVVFLLQVGWSVTAVRQDRRFSYDPSLETARFLQGTRAGTTMAAFHFWSTGIQPYYSHNPFLNMPSSWWQWSSNITVDSAHREVIDARPDLVVYSYENPEHDSLRNQIIPLNELTGYEQVDPILTYLEEHNYHETHHFCGRRFDRWSAAYKVCDVIFEPVTGGGKS